MKGLLIGEITDTPEKIEAFMSIIDSVMDGGVATLEKVRIKRYPAKAGS